MQRFELNPCGLTDIEGEYSCYADLVPSSEGDFVRYKDVEVLIAALKEIQNKVQFVPNYGGNNRPSLQKPCECAVLAAEALRKVGL